MEGHESAWDTLMLFIGGGAGTALLAFLSALRKPREGSEKSHGGTAVVGATMISDGAVDKLTTVIREAAESIHDDLRRHREGMTDLGDQSMRLERAVREGLPPVASMDIAGLMARLDRVERGK